MSQENRLSAEDLYKMDLRRVDCMFAHIPMVDRKMIGLTARTHDGRKFLGELSWIDVTDSTEPRPCTNAFEGDVPIYFKVAGDFAEKEASEIVGKVDAQVARSCFAKKVPDILTRPEPEVPKTRGQAFAAASEGDAVLHRKMQALQIRQMELDIEEREAKLKPHKDLMEHFGDELRKMVPSDQELLIAKLQTYAEAIRMQNRD